MARARAQGKHIGRPERSPLNGATATMVAVRVKEVLAGAISSREAVRRLQARGYEVSRQRFAKELASGPKGGSGS